MEAKKENNPMPTIIIAGAKFEIGRLYSTQGARDVMQQFELVTFLQQHAQGDWGNCCEEDWNRNDEALLYGGRILSVYFTQGGEKIWLITEADRSMTTFLLPSEY
jgi:hypothetical protein